jgi:hypothetical protein
MSQASPLCARSWWFIRKISSNQWGSLVSCVTLDNFLLLRVRIRKQRPGTGAYGRRGQNTGAWPVGSLTVASKPMPTTVSAEIPEDAIAYSLTKERGREFDCSRGCVCRSCDQCEWAKRERREGKGSVKSARL